MLKDEWELRASGRDEVGIAAVNDRRKRSP